MTTELLIRGFCSLLYSGAFAYVLFDRAEDGGDTDRQRYLPYISGRLLPLCLLTLVILGAVCSNIQTVAQITLSFCFGVFLHICLYYLVLMPALPFLRRHISARACAVLWLLPNYLYLTQMGYMQLPRPRWVVEAPSGLVWTLLGVWLAGVLAVLGWKIVSHLVFRVRILKPAVPVTEPAALEVWRREVEAARFKKPKFKLVTSPAVPTPLSVGLFDRSVRVVLPERDYSPEELALVFRHELIHIGREDAWSKFFLVFCTAMCWFNPLMWRAMKKSAEDLELSCDETVLLNCDEDTKRQYADLLLKTAGDERGFTTCLSASAGALRYRLKSVVDTKRKPSGALTVGLVFFLLCMSCGYVALAYGEGAGAELIYQSQDPKQFTLRHAQWEDDPYHAVLVCTDEDALGRYLSALPMEHIMGNYSFEPEGKSLYLMFDTPQGALSVHLSDQYVRLTPLYGEKIQRESYYLPGGTDWEALGECITELPALNLRLTGDEDEYGRESSATLWRAGPAEGGPALYEADPLETPGGIYGYSVTQAELSFSLPLEGALAVEIAPLKGGGVRTVTLQGQSPTLALEDGSFRCTVRGTFRGGNGKLYRAEFRFEVGDYSETSAAQLYG